jgi:(p)ppGpp synthase/HD superfamily hydrolase
MSEEHERILSRPLSERFEKAFDLAFHLHQKTGRQSRKGKDTPYIAHLMAVSAIVLEYGGNEDEAIAALLHDAMEDQGGRPTLERIRKEFGDRVAGIVEECSDCDGGDHKPAWKERKQAYLDHIPHMTSGARLVSLADKIHNARSVLNDFRRDGESTWSRFKGKRDGTLWYYAELSKLFSSIADDPPVRELRRIVEVLMLETSQSSER